MKVKELIDEFHKEAQPVQEPDELAVAYLSGFYDGRKKQTWVGLTDADIERIKLMTYEKETNDDGEEQEAVNIDWLIKTTEHF
jgi:hypothetical protein